MAEQNPAFRSFSHPLYCFAGDRAMWRDILIGRIKL